MGRPKKERQSCDPDVCKHSVFCQCGFCTRHCLCPSDDPQPLKTPVPARISHDETLLNIRASVSEEKSLQNIFDLEGLLEAFPPNQKFAHHLPKVRSSATIVASSDNSNYWGPLMLYIESIIESVCEVYAPYQVKGMMQLVMHRLAMRQDKELAARERAKAKRVAALKVADPDLYEKWTIPELKELLFEMLTSTTSLLTMADFIAALKSANQKNVEHAAVLDAEDDVAE